MSIVIAILLFLILWAIAPGPVQWLIGVVLWLLILAAVLGGIGFLILVFTA